MNFNKFNTTPYSHPELYCGDMYIGRHAPLRSGESISVQQCGEMLAIGAVNLGVALGNIVVTIANVMQRRMGAMISPDVEEAQKTSAVALIGEMQRRINLSGHQNAGMLIKMLNDAAEFEIPGFINLRSRALNIRQGGVLFSMFFGYAGNHIYSEYAAVHGDTFASLQQKACQITANMLSRLRNENNDEQGTKGGASFRPRIIQCPKCGRDVSTESKTCWFCDSPIIG